MTDIYTLAAKIRALPKRRIAEVEDFVDFLTLRLSRKSAKPAPAPKEEMQPLARRLAEVAPTS